MAEIASAYVSILPSAKGFGSKLNSEVSGPVSSSASSLGKTFGKLFALGAGVIAAAGIGNFLKDSVDEAREAQKVGAATTQIIKATGGAANISATQIGNLAGAISAKSGIDDEAIQTGTNLLLTFKQVRNEVGKGNDVFNQATQAAVDLSAAGFGSIDGSAKMLGKALNDPIKGVSALGRAGVTFTDQQKEQIKTLVESNDVLGAQKIILKEVQGQVGGVAAATATSGEKASVAFGNLKEQVGTALLPVIDRLATIFTTKVAPAISTFVTQLQSGEGAGGRVAAIFGQVGSVLSTVFGFINNNRTVTAVFIGSIVAMTIAFAAFNAVVSANPISLVIIAIAALAAGLVYAYKNSETFRNVVNKTFGFLAKYVPKVISTVVNFVKNHWRLLIVILGGPVGIAVALISKHFDKVKAAAQAVIGWIKNNWPAIKALVTGPFETAKTVIGKVWTALRQGASRVKEVVTGVFSAISAAIQGAIDKVQNLIDKLNSVRGKGVGKKGGSGTSADLGMTTGKLIVGGMITGVQSQQKALADAVDKVGKKAQKKLEEKIGKLRDQLSTARDDFASLVDPISSNFTQNLFDFDNAAAFGANLTTVKGTLNTLLGNFKKLIGEGLNPGFLYQLFQSGGPALINSLAGLSKSDALDISGTFGQITDLSTQLGTAVAGATDKGAGLQQQTAALEKKLEKLIKHVDKGAEHMVAGVNGAASSGRDRSPRKPRRAFTLVTS